MRTTRAVGASLTGLFRKSISVLDLNGFRDQRTGSQRWCVFRAAAIVLPLTLGWPTLGSAPAVAAAACDDLETGKCKVTLSTGITMAYVETGPESGPPVILIHGLTGSIRDWSFAMRALHNDDPNLHILAVELRGHGATSMPPASCAPAPENCFRLTNFASDIVAFMKAKNIPKATLVGFSLGSFTVQEVALSHPEMVDRAILIATGTKVVDNPALRDYLLKEPLEGSWKQALEAKGKKYPADFYELTPVDVGPKAEEWISKEWNADPAADPAIVEPSAPEISRVRLGTWIGATKAALTVDNTDRLKDLNVPTLVIWGTQDGVFLDDRDENALKKVLDAAGRTHGKTYYWKQYGVLPLPQSGAQESDIGHFVQGEAPDAVAADIKAFIRTGAPTKDLAHSDKVPNVSHIVMDPGKATVVQLGQ
jgi:pimeloyl-ACP methyl ester carboxylesterase